jgi:glycosyltransferase involved in cell wall biosynthesis
VHTHLVHADLYGLAAARRAGVAAAVSSRHDNNPFRRGRVVGWLNRRAMRHARRVIAISRAVAQFVIDVEGIDSRKVVTVHYGLEPGSISPAQRALARAALGCSESGFVIGFVGRLIEQKGVDVLIDAFPAIRERHPQATLVIVGDGPLRERLRARAERLGLGASARFAGWVPQARSIMPACDLVAMPSRWEGFGLTALEAMACGLPLVASDVDALPEILRDQETGLLVPPDDSRALAAAINGLLDRPEWAAQLGGHGRERVLRFFSVERMAGATIDVYIAALADARGSRDAVPVGT